MRDTLARYYQFDAAWRQGGHDCGLLLLRLLAGGLMLGAHGWPKLRGFSDRLHSFADPLGLGSEVSLTLAVFAEVFCSLAVMLGLLTRAAAVPVAFTMLVAAFVVHADDPWNKQEFALTYAVMFSTLIATGAGRYSLDRLLRVRLQTDS